MLKKMSNNNLYYYLAKPVAVIDGDTIEVIVSVGFDITIKQKLRLLRVNTPELKDKNSIVKDAAKKAKEFTIKWLENNCKEEWSLLIKSEKHDSFDRYLAEIYSLDGKCLNDDLLSSGNAIIFKKKKKNNAT